MLHWIRVGDIVVNLDNVVDGNLEASLYDHGGHVSGVELTTTGRENDGDGVPISRVLTFKGEDAERLRAYFRSMYIYCV